MMNTHTSLDHFMEGLDRRNPGESEFHQAVYEVATDVIPYIKSHPIYHEAQILERLTEPDRIIIFRVTWEDDAGHVRTNRGIRIQHSNAIGPYKGGTRFQADLHLSVLKFLAFEQTFKNSLTGLPLGSAKGGADFNPKGKSDREVMRFCQAYMVGLMRYIGPKMDIPAGDIGVGAREIGYMFGHQLRISNQFVGVLTGKNPSTGGSLGRDVATGYGTVYILEDMLHTAGQEIAGHTALVSGSGNVAIFAAEKLIELGAKVLTLSDSSGFIHDPQGITLEKLAFIKQLKFEQRGRISAYAEEYGVSFHAGKQPWDIPADLVLPCATQNEIDGKAAKRLVENGCVAVSEGANMPSDSAAIHVFQSAGVLYMPAKAANAGGVAVSGLEMAQNSMNLSWKTQEVDARLREIMSNIHDQCREYGRDKSGINYAKGANIAGFIKVANAMLSHGI